MQRKLEKQLEQQEEGQKEEAKEEDDKTEVTMTPLGEETTETASNSES